ncbi:hypothetical protein B0T25DRAFT_571216 [Lasiosphaeria hispida]|uniref:Uncharacterized protein n=1 Tax=Lasiosphaeria hispida TaxID=260671 RepID=A0AAJ0MAE9_9PEZI|nr:hypothetical protein B0T25DRAFT_571216 [Lasiosphaeria hispida]
MSWAMDRDPTWEFAAQADSNHFIPPQPFSLDVWEITAANPDGAWEHQKPGIPTYLEAPPTGLRIILAPLDLPQKATKAAFLALFKAIGIPQAFIRERLQSVSHSFGSVSNQDKHCVWFHFLCKHIEIAEDAPTVVHRGPLRGSDETLVAHQADYTWRRSGFFLFADGDKRTVTLCCFGAEGKVEERLRQFLKRPGRRQALDEPYVLLDVVLDGLYSEVDNNVWNMNAVFGALERRLLVASTSRGQASTSKEVTFAELHNVAKHMIHLREAVESCLHLTDSIIRRAEESPQTQSQLGKQPERISQTRQEVRDLLLYRQSLFRSTKLRLESLNQRVANSIGLSFNLLTVADSSILIQHSSVMKIMAAITTIFLPTTAVAAIMGSQLFATSFDDENWTVRPTPLFGVLWAVAVPLTIVVLIFAALWHWRTHRTDEKEKGLARRITGL